MSSSGEADRRATVEQRATKRPRPPEVVVVGAVNVDFVVVAGSLPSPGETVVGPRCERYGGGKGANAAVAAARAGAQVRLVGAVGGDEIGEGALRELREAGVAVQGVAVLAEEPTGVALIVVDSAGENQIAVGAGANAALSASWVRHALADALPGCGCLLVSTEIPNDTVLAAVACARQAGVPCVLNPVPPIPAVLEALGAGPLLTPNATELEALSAMLERASGGPAKSPPESGAQRAGALAAATGAPVVVTLGGEGALLVQPGHPPARIAARETTVRDTTGAGDTFNGVLAASIAAGDPLARAVEVATVAAGISVGGAGARGGMPDAAQLEAALATL
jgi:ribokinase